MQSKTQVFLSHASEDKERVMQVKKILEENDISCWIDSERIGLGDSLFASIEKGLNESDLVVFFISKKSVQSPWVLREVASTFYKKFDVSGPRLIPVKLDEVEVPTLLADLVWTDLTDSDSIEGA